MKWRSLVLGLVTALCPLAHPMEAGFFDSVKEYLWKQEVPKPSIKVLVSYDQPSALLEVRGKYKIYDPNTGELLSTKQAGKRQHIQSVHLGMKWGEEFPGVHQLQITPLDPNVPFYLNGMPLVGSLYVYDIGGVISIVNEMPIENYVLSILTHSYQEDIAPEALSAVTIAARTQAAFSAKHPKNKFWSVDARKVGFNGVVLPSADPISHAVHTTENMILSQTNVYDGITPFPAQWGSMTGGRAQGENVVFSRITLFEVEAMANRGENASQILSKAFPNTNVTIMQ